MQNTRVGVIPKTFAAKPFHETIGSAFFTHFSLHFGVSQRQSPVLCRSIFAFRHKVYCEQLGFEEPNSAGLERDEWDRTAIHFAISHNKTGKIVACARLLPANDAQSLPIAEFCGDEALDLGVHPSQLQSSSACELSRFIVDSEFSSPRAAIEAGFAEASVAVGQLRYVLAQMTMEYALRADWPHMFVLSEPRFIRVLRIAGMPIKAIDDYVNFKGLRRVAYSCVNDFFDAAAPAFMHARQILSQHLLEESQTSLMFG
ncbi:acyl-homoserine-lactone synthase [Bowmanella sp. JS7-9]|uniref:Acyl-homoserine-lactone synthase n=1 Tax=Pseudobowmanella zhangzhouensis TaxID=1537679 RepID=A0ABW1XQ92_9ALTE|nr:PEP-CTERM/exosortase system-associated acyltransferase [Bowmanella sp. JS7-9]TBX23601.1 hypothetical protein TK45_05645 [Bowmanella sp. JS7-9]